MLTNLRRSALSGVILAGYLVAAANPVMAADLGGDCCADLEERIAELEATTARKGNRKVSLTVSGQVNQLVLFWDDGYESNVYQTDNNNSSTRFRFTGSAKITPEFSAGYALEIEADTSRSNNVSQINDDAPGGINLRIANWYIEHKHVGRLTVGQGSSATDDIILSDVEGVSPAGYSNIISVGGGFLLRSSNGMLITTTTINEFAANLDTSQRNVVRYDTPLFQGAKIVAAWGEDDFWDVALWFAGQQFGFKYAGGIGYLEDTDTTAATARDSSEIKGSISVLHVSTGLFVSYAFVHREFEVTSGQAAFPDFDYHYLRPGIVVKAVPLGTTSFFGEYANAKGGIDGRLNEAGLGLVTASELEVWGLGIEQNIDAAALELYLVYRNYSLEASGVTGGVAAAASLENLNVVYTGARIRF